jgi:predicted TIM-barrel fold metal-dependent hydrolase
VPIYLHPGYPHPAVVEAYFKDYIQEFPMLARPAWGYTMETATIAIRMVLSGVFDEYPKLRMVLGHMGESIPFSLWRIDQSLARQNQMKRRFREIFCEHFWITTSGNFSTPALICSMLEMGVDRILFSVDWPFVANEPGVEWIESAPISEEDRVKLMNGNAKKLLKL